MAKKTGVQTQQIYIGGYDCSGDIGAIEEISTPRLTFPVTGINKNAMERIIGKVDAMARALGYFNDATGQIHDALKSLVLTDIQAMYMFSSTLGDPVFFFTAKEIDYPHSRKSDGSYVLHTTLSGNLEMFPEWGKSLTAGKRTDTSATNGTSIDDGAATTAGLGAQLQVFGVTGTSVTVSIQDSPDNSSWTTRLSFTAATGRTTERKTWSGSPARYVRAITAGTFSSGAFALAYRRGLSVDDKAYT